MKEIDKIIEILSFYKRQGRTILKHPSKVEHYRGEFLVNEEFLSLLKEVGLELTTIDTHSRYLHSRVIIIDFIQEFDFNTLRDIGENYERLGLDYLL